MRIAHGVLLLAAHCIIYYDLRCWTFGVVDHTFFIGGRFIGVVVIVNVF